MDFVLWACRVMHVLSVVVWVGGLIFFNAVMRPIVEYEQATRMQLNLEILKRFQAFIWSSVWSLAITGLLLMLLSPRFVWFDYSTGWLKLLAVKQVSFFLLIFFSWQMVKVLQHMQKTVGAHTEEFKGWWLAYTKLVKRSIGVGIVALLVSAGMMVV